MVEGAPLAVHLECDAGDWRQLLWYDRRLMPGGTRLDFDRIRPTTLRPFGLMWRGPTEPGQVLELRFGFSLRGVEQARAQPARRLRHRSPARFERAGSAETAHRLAQHLDKIAVETSSAERQRPIFSTALYHSLIKPCFAPEESPFWPTDGPFVFDICTMWDIYRTQLPLITALFPERAVELANALLYICEEEGNLPIGYRMAKGADRFSRQGSALAHTFFADLCQLGHARHRLGLGAGPHGHRPAPGVRGGLPAARGRPPDHPHPRPRLRLPAAPPRWPATSATTRWPTSSRGSPRRWVNAFDPTTGLLVDSAFYEGGKWNYSFRLLHDMQARIELAGGDEAFVALLDAFFGYGADPVKQVGERPASEDLAAGYALNRFEGLNNEPDMEAPWAYHYAGRPDRTAEVVHAAVNNMFGLGRGGLPGNDDSGGLSSWYVWASLGHLPGGRPEPLSDQRPVVRPVADRHRPTRSWPSRPTASSSRCPAGPCSTSSRSPSTASRWTAPG